MENVICVYAIAKNEIDFVDRWLDSMSEADYVVILDTGSTDGTYEKLLNDSRVTKVKKKTYKNFRFDKARNDSMELVPKDANILVCTDLDEIFESGWADVLRDHWEDNDTRCSYSFAYEHDDTGAPSGVFMNDRIHTKDYHWVYPIHEILKKNNDDMEEYILEAEDNIYLHHLPDKSKNRSFYINLLNTSVEENPEDGHCRSLLARGYFILEKYEEALYQYLQCLNYKDINEDAELEMTKADCYLKIGDLYYLRGEYDEALKYYRYFLSLYQDYREPYLKMARVYNAMGLYVLAIYTTLAAIDTCKRHYNWLEDTSSWVAEADDILSIAYYNTGNINKALYHSKIAAEKCFNDIRIVTNLNIILMKKYEGIDRGTVY